MVINIPLYGIQVVTSYNCITKDIVISLRLPLIDGNNGDRNNASSNGCTLTCLTVEFNKNKIDQITFGPSPRPFPPPSGAFHGFNSSLPPPPPPPMLPKPKPLTSPVETPPPLPGKRVSSLRESQTGTIDDNFNQAIDKIDKVITKIHDGLFPNSQHNIPNQFQQPQQQQFQQQQYQQQNQGQQQQVQVQHPPVYNTITPPAIPTRPNTFTTQTNGSHYYYSTQTQWSTSYGFGRQTSLGTTQSSTVTNYSTIQQQQYTTSRTNSAPTTPTTQPQPLSTTTTSLSSSTTTTTKTEPVRKAGEQFNNVVNRAADGIDKGITKVSNIFSSRKNNPNTTQQQQQNTIVKAS
uniref:Uncharacterized protein n=1 Tax=Panagrolaimus davidi TaxID=227884 RepID=A0A914PFE8_9BILA